MSQGDTALVAAGVALVVGLATGAVSIFVARIQAKHAVELKREELRTEYMAEAAIHRLLKNPRWSSRTFGTIQRWIGDGFDEKELRRLLVRAGAVCIPDRTGRDRELWGLVDRNEDVLG
ncbi:hypothetical protein AB0H92_14380 [Streptomyces phaeochromogenes]|uniref:hypothetical protein n=1 Tax=Streptomyces phaeochromogenes TaxID=1923 RepID=UPI0033FA7239